MFEKIKEKRKVWKQLQAEYSLCKTEVKQAYNNIYNKCFRLEKDPTVIYPEIYSVHIIECPKMEKGCSEGSCRFYRKKYLYDTAVAKSTAVALECKKAFKAYLESLLGMEKSSH